MVLLSFIFTAIVLPANTVPAAEAPPTSLDRFAFVTSEADNSLTIIALKTEKMIKTLPKEDGENMNIAGMFHSSETKFDFAP
jgi:hypothetical protein